MTALERLGGVGWEARIWRLMSRRGFSGTLAIGLVILAIFLGSFTYMTLTGLTPLKPGRGRRCG